MPIWITDQMSICLFSEPRFPRSLAGSSQHISLFWMLFSRNSDSCGVVLQRDLFQSGYLMDLSVLLPRSISSSTCRRSRNLPLDQPIASCKLYMTEENLMAEILVILHSCQSLIPEHGQLMGLLGWDWSTGTLRCVWYPRWQIHQI